MTASDLSRLIAAADLDDADDCLVLADALDEAGRTDEAVLLRNFDLALRVRGGVVEAAPAYTLTVGDEGGSEETYEHDAEPTAQECEDAAIAWCKDGDWGEEGARISLHWRLEDAAGETVDEGDCEAEIEPDHDALIRAAGGDTDCDHEWEATAEIEGGLRENPGVWCHGGTSLSCRDHCVHCGLQRRRYYTGSQRNPGEHDTVSYEQPEHWCAECQREECRGPGKCDSWVEIGEYGSGDARGSGTWYARPDDADAVRAAYNDLDDDDIGPDCDLHVRAAGGVLVRD